MAAEIRSRGNARFGHASLLAARFSDECQDRRRSGDAILTAAGTRARNRRAPSTKRLDFGVRPCAPRDDDRGRASVRRVRSRQPTRAICRRPKPSLGIGKRRRRSDRRAFQRWPNRSADSRRCHPSWHRAWRRCRACPRGTAFRQCAGFAFGAADASDAQTKTAAAMAAADQKQPSEGVCRHPDPRP